MSDNTTEGLSVGNVFARSFGAIAANWLTLALVGGAFSVIPNALAGWIRVESGLYDPADFMQTLRGVYGEQLVVNLIGIIALIGATRVMARLMDAKRTSFAQAFQNLGGVFLGALGLSIVINLAVGLGLVLLIVPGLILLTYWAVAMPARVIEDRGFGEAISRSVSLTEGRRWSVFGVLLLIGLIAFCANFFGGLLLGFSPIWFQEIVGMPVLLTLTVIVGPIFSAGLYFELRRLKEGPINTVAEVFA